MTRMETKAYNAGVRAALDMARTAAITIETGEGSDELPKRGAAAALYSFADAAKALLIDPRLDPISGHEGEP